MNFADLGLSSTKYHGPDTLSTTFLNDSDNTRWIKQYIYGDYNKNHTLFHNLPIRDQQFLDKNTLVSHHGVKVYRGLTFPNIQWARDWYSNQVLRWTPPFLELKINSISSWSLCENVAIGFAKGHGSTVRQKNKFGMVLCMIINDTPIWDLQNLHSWSERDCEVLLKPGKFKCEITSVFKDHKSDDSWLHF